MFNYTKVLSSVEAKNTGLVTRQLKEKINEKSGFARDSFYLKDEDVAYALGKGGSTRSAFLSREVNDIQSLECKKKWISSSCERYLEVL